MRQMLCRRIHTPLIRTVCFFTECECTLLVKLFVDNSVVVIVVVLVYKSLLAHVDMR